MKPGITRKENIPDEEVICGWMEKRPPDGKGEKVETADARWWGYNYQLKPKDSGVGREFHWQWHPVSLTLDRIWEVEVRIEAGFAQHQIRNDGWPKGGNAPAHPGVVLYFTTKDGALSFPCGTYDSMAANLQAIALTLENLRAIDRYGATLGHEQYRGFAALPAPKTQGTLEDAAALMASMTKIPARDLIASVDAYRLAYRQLAAELHPDKGGPAEKWHAFQNAAILLQKHHSGGLA